MKKCIIGKKVGMTQLFDQQGVLIPVTVIEAGPCVVTQKKSIESDGYSALQIGFMDAKQKSLNKPLMGHFSKSDLPLKKHLKEFRLDNCDDFKVGDIIKVDIFEVGNHVDVVGISKGKGYAGAIKRWNFQRLKESHGSGPVVRHAGSMGACSDPSRVMKGKKLPGHLGVERVTVQNLNIVKIDQENNLIVLKGAVPGPKGGLIYMTDTVKFS